MNVFTPERVTLDLSREEHLSLIFALGMASGGIVKDGGEFPMFLLRLANTINEGNPDWTPYEVPPEEDAKP